MGAGLDAALSRLSLAVREASRGADVEQGVHEGQLDHVAAEVRRVAALGASPDEIAVAGALSINWVRSVLGVIDLPLRDRLGNTMWVI